MQTSLAKEDVVKPIRLMVISGLGLIAGAWAVQTYQ